MLQVSKIFKGLDFGKRNNPQELYFSKLEQSADNVKLEKVLGSFPDTGEKKLKFMSCFPDLGD